MFDDDIEDAVRRGDIANVSELLTQSIPDTQSRVVYSVSVTNPARLFYLAATHGHASIIQLLQQHNLNIDAIDDHNHTALDMAVSDNNIAAISMLREYGATLGPDITLTLKQQDALLMQQYRRQVTLLTCIRSLEPSSVLAGFPNEMLFAIFEFLAPLRLTNGNQPAQSFPKLFL